MVWNALASKLRRALGFSTAAASSSHNVVDDVESMAEYLLNPSVCTHMHSRGITHFKFFRRAHFV